MRKVLSILSFLLISFNLFSNELDSLFYQAFLMEDYNLMSEYVQQGANIDRAYNNDQGVSLLHNFAFYGIKDGVVWCIENGANVNVLDKNDFTPIYYAALNQQIEICEILIQNGANLTHVAQGVLTLEQIAKNVGNPGLGKYFQGKAKKPTDFNHLRNEVIIASKDREYHLTIKKLKSAIKDAKSTLDSNNKFNILLWIDLADIYSLLGETVKYEEAINNAYNYAKNNAYSTEYYYYALAEKCILWLNNNNVYEAVDSLMVCYRKKDAFSDYETKFVVSTAMAYAAKSLSSNESAINFYFEALSYAKDLKFLSDDLHADKYALTILSICELYIVDRSSDGINYAMALLQDIGNDLENRNDYLSALYACVKGELFILQGDYPMAEYYLQKAEQDWYNSMGVNHTAYSNIIYLLAEVNFAQYEIERSIQLYKISLGGHLQRDTYNSYASAVAKKSLARAMLMSNILGEKQYNFSEIDNYLYNAITNISDLKGREDLEFIDAVTTLCNSLVRQNDTTQLRTFYQIPLDLTKKVVSADNYRYQLSLLNSAYLAQFLKDYSTAYNNIIEYDSLSKKDVIEHFFVLPEEQRRRYWLSHHQNAYESIIPTFIHNHIQQNPELSTLAYNNALFTKGLLLHTTNSVKRAIQESDDSLLFDLFDTLQTMTQSYQELTSQPIHDYDKIHSLREDIFSIEQYLTSKCKSYLDYKSQSNSNWEDIQTALKPNQIAVEFIHFDYEQSDTVLLDRYVAIVVTPACQTPYYLPLFDFKAIEDLVNVVNKDLLFTSTAGNRSLFNLVWEKLLPYVPENGEIVFSPDGILCELPIEHLPCVENIALSDKYRMTRCSSTKNLLVGSSNDFLQEAVLYGGITYDINVDELQEVIQDTTPKNRSDVNYRGHYNFLPGAEMEVNNISRLFNHHEITHQKYSKQFATEESFKSLSGTSPKIIHIATHGFYWPEAEAARKDLMLNKYRGASLPMDSIYINPLERCGLLFAGANIAMSGHADEIPVNIEDGILSAREISNLDLSNTDMVVLSACETGTGELMGDGIYGLQRAFKLAGVQTIIMSLWKVDDMATNTLMTEFYSAWLKGMDKRTAFHYAQRKTRDKYPEPSYWAGFIILD